MNIQWMLNGINQYGLVLIFLVVFFEYLNLPGFPSGIILPFSGVWASNGHSFLLTFFISVCAGLLGSVLLYYVGRFGGTVLVHKFIGKSEKARQIFINLQDKMKQDGWIVVFVGKLIPVVRTLVGIPAGILHMNLPSYLLASTIGICIWNGVFLGAGYFFGIMAF